MGNVLEGTVLNEGNLDCNHGRVFYEDNSFDGQAFWCDIKGCGRHVCLGYSPGDKLKFPSDALISTPNPEYGGEVFYAFRVNDEGLAELLERKNWVERRVVGVGSVI